MYGINVVGFGKVGSALVALIADAGFSVNVFDSDKNLFELYTRGTWGTQEPEVQNLISKNQNRINFLEYLKFDPDKFIASMVIVPTPSTQEGSFESKYVEDAVLNISSNIIQGSKHAIIIKSTLSPGSMNLLSEKLRENGLRSGIDFELFYYPEFIALGSIVRDMRNPDMALIGLEDSMADLSQIEALQRKIWVSNPTTHLLSFTEAEIAKLGLNTFITLKISFANFIGEIVRERGSGNPSSVLAAIGSDSRVGKKYLSPGLGFGGPCFPRDNLALAETASQIGLDPLIPLAAHNFNEQFQDLLLGRITRLVPSNSAIAVLGLAYKGGTSDITKSQSLYIAIQLESMGYDVHPFDPKISGFIPGLTRPVRQKIEQYPEVGSVLLLTPSEETIAWFQEAPDNLIRFNPWC